MAYPRFQLARTFKTARRASTSPTYALTTWGDVDTALDLTLAAQVGDMIEVEANGLWGNEASTAHYMDVVTVVSATPVNSFGTQGAVSTTSHGIQAWQAITANYSMIAGGGIYPIVAGDLSSGYVTLRLRRRGETASTKTLYAVADQPFQWWVKNLGPVDPN